MNVVGRVGIPFIARLQFTLNPRHIYVHKK
jgi:hypothetical protein